MTIDALKSALLEREFPERIELGHIIVTNTSLNHDFWYKCWLYAKNIGNNEK